MDLYSVAEVIYSFEIYDNEPKSKNLCNKIALHS